MNKNSVTRTFGDAFNKGIEETIENIKMINRLENFSIDINFEDIEMVMYNCDYYVRNEADKDEFIRKCDKIFRERKIVEKENSEWFSWCWWAANIVELIQRSFDETYFKEQIALRRKNAAPGSKCKLRMYFEKFSMEQLKEYFKLVHYCMMEHGWFVSPNEWDEMSFSLEMNAAQEIHKRFPDMNSEMLNSIEEKPLYFLDYLDKEYIEYVLFVGIDDHVTVAENIAEMLYNCGYKPTLQYVMAEITAEG